MSDDPNNFGGPPAGGTPPSQGGFGQPQGQQGQGGFGQPQGQPPQSQGGFGQPQGQGGFQQPAAPPQGEYGGPPAGYGAQAQQQPPGSQGGFGGGMGPQGGPPYGGPPSGGGDELPQGWKIASIVLLILGPVLSVIGMIPCLGLVNWLAIPTNVALAIVGTLALIIGPKMPDGKAADFPIHVAAVVLGVLLAIASVVRCLMGSGVV